MSAAALRMPIWPMATQELSFLILPGHGGSGPEHWQSRWERHDPRFRRVEQHDWERPDCSVWREHLQQQLAAAAAPVVLVAHSLGCLLVAHWAAAYRTDSVAAALLVAPPDPAGPSFPATACGFTPIPLQPLPFPSMVIASRNDPFGSAEFAAACAHAWGSGFRDIGAAGHINADSGLGLWRDGLGLLHELLNTAGIDDASADPV